ncbi:MAG: PHP domain-containing protein [Bacteroidota bacterium]
MIHNRRVDLHVHTLASEGQLTLSNQFAYAQGSGLRAIAVADLDVLPDVEQGRTLSAQFGVEFIPGVEISAGWEGSEIHILGYYIDPHHRRMRERLSHMLASREAHVQIMIYKLKKENIRLEYADILHHAAHSSYVGRVHIARAMVEKGYIGTPREAFTEKYIGVDGDCYYPTSSLSVLDAIDLILDAGGIAVLAHPALYNHRAGITEPDIMKMKDAGLRGLEVFHACHTGEEARRYDDIARKLNLIATGGSACRGVNYDPVVNYKPFVSEDVLTELIQKPVAA